MGNQYSFPQLFSCHVLFVFHDKVLLNFKLYIHCTINIAVHIFDNNLFTNNFVAVHVIVLDQASFGLFKKLTVSLEKNKE